MTKGGAVAASAVLASAVLFVVGCGPGGSDDAAERSGASPGIVDLPRGFPPMVVPEDNPTTRAGVALGRRLYYDERLSNGGTRACADCHLQERAFSNPAATGVLAHMNLAWARYFLWDGSEEGTLEDVMRFEVEEFFETEVARLREPDLEELFLAAFGTPEVTTERAAFALAQFQRTLVSGDSRYDRYANGETAALSDAEVRGMQLFYSERAECFHCHATALFTDNRFHNIGLEAEVEGTGRAAVTGRRIHDGAYKTPTLRNVAVTGPYMHDDRFATLEEVIDFYSEGVVFSPSIDSLMPNPQGGGASLTPGERSDLVAFLRALTDDEFLRDPRFGAP